MSTPDIKLKFKNVEVISLNMTPRPKNWVTGNPYEFDLKIESQVNPDHKLIIILSDIKIREYKTDNVLASIVVACMFEAENFSESVIKRKDGIFQIPTDTDVVIKTMSVSTVRGIMFSEFRGTYLYEAILPIIIIPAAQIKPEQVVASNSD